MTTTSLLAMALALAVPAAVAQRPADRAFDEVLQKFLGRPLSYDAFFREMGIGTTGTTKATR